MQQGEFPQGAVLWMKSPQNRQYSPTCQCLAIRLSTLMRHLLLTLPCIIMLASCASTPDPAEVCSAEWITPRTSSAVTRIEKRATKSIQSLNKAGESWAKGKTPGPLDMFALSNAMKKLEKELTRGQGITDLKMVARTCNDPKIVSDAMRGLLERQGVSSDFIGRIENSPIYQRLMSQVSAPEPVKSKI